MVYDFSANCKHYNKDSYAQDSFINTRCPGCLAIGRFNLHGSYSRHVIYRDGISFIYKYIDIKRIRCVSCGKTHAVLPGDIIAYRLLSLCAFLFIVFSHYISNISVLQLSLQHSFSFQFIYSVLYTFKRFESRIHNLFKILSPGTTPDYLSSSELVYILNLYFPAKFQFKYMKLNIRPCFTCRLFCSLSPPDIAFINPYPPLKGRPT